MKIFVRYRLQSDWSKIIHFGGISFFVHQNGYSHPPCFGSVLRTPTICNYIVQNRSKDRTFFQSDNTYLVQRASRGACPSLPDYCGDLSIGGWRLIERDHRVRDRDEPLGNLEEAAPQRVWNTQNSQEVVSALDDVECRRCTYHIRKKFAARRPKSYTKVPIGDRFV